MENQSLVLDLVDWVSRAPRPYDDVMDAWRTSCPRLTVWEDAELSGYVERTISRSGELYVRATPTGVQFLRTNGRG